MTTKKPKEKCDAGKILGIYNMLLATTTEWERRTLAGIIYEENERLLEEEIKEKKAKAKVKKA